MILKPTLNIGFYFIRNGSLTCMKNVFGHGKLNFKLSLFQNLDIDYTLSPIGNHSNEFSISLFCQIPKSKLLTKKKLWSRGGEIGSVHRKATLLNVRYGRVEVLSDHKTFYAQWRLLGQRADDHLQQHCKTKDKFQIVPTHQRPLARRDLKLHQLVPLGSTWVSIHSLKQDGGVLGNWMVYAFFIGSLGFGFWAKIKSSLTGWPRPKKFYFRKCRLSSHDKGASASTGEPSFSSK